ncbi:hypothetical protein SASPL_101149 [Salvia splendens]|uniref:Sulfotransferase n=1 Tax=Salvia splendens TaxID=180675 RepID=A0A8X8YVB0_SALSN|nr:hypothetical protein SASPL_101149 [Salvia splendens]
MADALDSLMIIRPSKKKPLVLRMVVLIIAVASSIYICSTCLSQIGGRSAGSSSPSIRVVQKPCGEAEDHILPSEKPYVHFPKPNTFTREECACNPVRYFAILSMQRSGSGWFETLLNSHVNISSKGEIFSVKVRRSNISTILETLDRVYNLDWHSSASKNECTAAVGLKWMLNQFCLGLGLLGLVQKNKANNIFLTLRNFLRRMVSILGNSYDQKAKPLIESHKSHAEILARYKPTIDTKLLIPDLEQVEDLVTRSLQYFNSTRHIILYYENIRTNQTKLVDVQEFLKIENWEEVERTLKGTRYEHFLEDDYKLGKVAAGLLPLTKFWPLFYCFYSSSFP